MTLNKTLLVFVVLFLAAVIGAFFSAPFEASKKLGGDFSLNYDGEIWQFSENSKKLNLLYFGFVRCPDVCPMSMSSIGKAFKKLNEEELKKVNMIFVSVDYDADTPQDVKLYAHYFNKSFIGLVGTKNEIDFVTNLYESDYAIHDRSIMHADTLYFVNSEGELISSIETPVNPKDITTKVKGLL